MKRHKYSRIFTCERCHKIKKIRGHSWRQLDSIQRAMNRACSDKLNLERKERVESNET